MAVSVDLMGELAAMLDALCAADPLTLGDGETVTALHRQLERLEALTTRATAAFDAAGSLLESARSVNGECFERDQAMLVGQARELAYAPFARAVAYWIQLADPDQGEDDAEAAYAARRLHLSKTFRDTWCLDGLLDPIGGSIVHTALGRIEAELFAGDWAEARARVGEGVK
ncbi:MAG: hypothetical protein LC792_14680, partial [Actinobacteria bacterium]|nr:hypothetical protein [Actinomycetota bacterium]